ncbi:unnamed protein product [Eruca vesicaria subsp. sativa]|uniref:Zinc finger PHD-type domain-containing protein n=1 Tax=Eruca vesicaria subsp. sativa TaxID=29727 RepID=A0ABC8J9K4_ERUVS|nr:unnamed protein product [Eruca vesicaria subsp. sativa]
MDSVEHPPLPHLLCPIFRYFSLSLNMSVKDDGSVIIKSPFYISNTERKNFLPYVNVDHPLYPLYWCNNKESGNESSCGVCKSKTVGTTYYFCCKCKVSFHKECVESPPLIKSVHHPKHHLKLFTSGNISCSYCDESGGDSRLVLNYYCSICKFGLDPVCAESPSFLRYHKRHEHILHHFTRKADLICDVCGILDRKSLIFVCLQCEYIVHKNCIYLPFVIRISRHNHRLSFTYSLPKILSCGVCRQEVDNNYGNYSCMKDCTYVVHSKCATRRDVWDGKELEEEPEEEYENLNSFEVIGSGLIKHSSHSHHMKYEEKTADIMYHDKRQCEACGLPLYGGCVYKCMKSKCDFVLHEACANLPRVKQHMAHPFPLSLQICV